MILRSACILLALLALICGSASTAQAQYFGQNKVQYEKFDFKVKKTEHFDIYYYPEEEQAVDLAARMAERWYAFVARAPPRAELPAADHPLRRTPALPADQRALGRDR